MHGLTPEARLVPEGHTATRATQIRMDGTATRAHGAVWASVAFEETWTTTKYPAAVGPCPNQWLVWSPMAIVSLGPDP